MNFDQIIENLLLSFGFKQKVIDSVILINLTINEASSSNLDVHTNLNEVQLSKFKKGSLPSLIKSYLPQKRSLSKTIFHKIITTKLYYDALEVSVFLDETKISVEDVFSKEPLRSTPELLLIRSQSSEFSVIPLGVSEIPVALILIPIIKTKEIQLAIKMLKENKDLIFETYLFSKIIDFCKLENLQTYNNEVEVVQELGSFLSDLFLPKSIIFSHFPFPSKTLNCINWEDKPTESIPLTLDNGFRITLSLYLEDNLKNELIFKAKSLVKTVTGIFNNGIQTWKMGNHQINSPENTLLQILEALEINNEGFQQFKNLISDQQFTIKQLNRAIKLLDFNNELPYENLFYFDGKNWVIYFESQKVNYAGSPNSGFFLIQYLLLNPNISFEAPELREELDRSVHGKRTTKKDEKVSPFELSELKSELFRLKNVVKTQQTNKDQLISLAVLIDTLRNIIRHLKNQPGSKNYSSIDKYSLELKKYRKEFNNVKFYLQIEEDNEEFIELVLSNSRLMEKPQGKITELKNKRDGIRNNIKNSIFALENQNFKTYLENNLQYNTRKPFRFSEPPNNLIDWVFDPRET